MSTTLPTPEKQTSVSAEAFELLQVFYEGVDVLVRELAEEIASERGSRLEGDESVIAIEVEDVRKSGERIIDAIHSLLKDGEFSARLQKSIEEMGANLKSHSS